MLKHGLLNPELSLEINKSKKMVRVKGNEKVKRHFHRTFGHSEELIETMLSSGFKEGRKTYFAEEFLDKVSSLSGFPTPNHK